MSQANSLTVITICYNNLSDAVSTCNSVDSQKTKPFEHLIIDGSSDQRIKSFLNVNPQPDYRRWICEPDDGIADAFNKGIKNSKGNILVMLNAGDSFYDENAIGTALKYFTENKSLMWMHGRYKLQRGNQQVIIGKPFNKNKLYRGMRSVCHQSMFVKKDLHSKYGLYNTKEKIAMDYDFLCRIKDENFLFTDAPLVSFAPAGISSVNYLESLKAIKRVYNKHFGTSLLLELWQVRLKILFYLLRSPIGNFLYSIKTRLKLENL